MSIDNFGEGFCMEAYRRATYQMPFEATINCVNGKWKPYILCHLLAESIVSGGSVRYGELLRLIPTVTKRMLTLHLRELERDGLIKRVIVDELPLRVDYSITEHGKSVYKLLMTMIEWGKTHLTFLEEQELKLQYQAAANGSSD
ncbi:winged helix-turn-helix transcriptional regulator [Paenibacillus sacheonensis]|nr:helix-turn-helix domain-containing protein [Paenibacillus sacheonensis]MBM7564292.1 DNA-binding HxlR family transcriptional regulator [Paenibacillus sacheonensis]